MSYLDMKFDSHLLCFVSIWVGRGSTPHSQSHFYEGMVSSCCMLDQQEERKGTLSQGFYQGQWILDSSSDGVAPNTITKSYTMALESYFIQFYRLKPHKLSMTFKMYTWRKILIHY